MATKEAKQTPDEEKLEQAQTEAETPAEEQSAPETKTRAKTAKAAAQEAEKENELLKDKLSEMQLAMEQMQEQMLQQAELMKQMAAGGKPHVRQKSETERDHERLTEIARKAAEEGTSAWSIEVEIRVPRRQRGEDPWYWVNVNGKGCQIPADDTRQKMKLPYALILTDKILAERRAEAFEDSIEVYDPKDNPHPDKD